MIAGLKPYAEYKDSGLPWLGQVPAHWRTVRNGSLFSQRSQTGFAELPILEVSLKTGVQVRAFGSAKRKQVMSDLAKYKRAAKGDLAYNTMRMWQGALGVCPVDGLVSPAYVVARPYAGVEPQYFAALFRTGDYMAEIDAASRGIVKDRNRLYWDQFKQMQSPCPPPDEQSAIVRFLEWANGRLGRAIRAKRRVISLLNEQKKVVVHNAISKGIDPLATLKASGIAWLGDIPQHWEAARLKRVLVGKLTNGLFKRGDAYGSGVPLVNVANLYSPDNKIRTGKLERVRATPKEIETFRVMQGDVFFVRSSLKFEGTGRCSFIESVQPGTVFECHVVRARPDQRIALPRFIATFLASWVGVNNTVSRANTVTMSTLTQGSLSSLPMVIPPLVEQSEILRSLDSALKPLERAVSRLEREIELLHEYRTRLVAEVVTGKLDVREAAACLPEDVTADAETDHVDESDDPELIEEEATEA